MRFSQLLAPTMKETPADAQVMSHRLMMRAGMIRKLASGVYTYLPLGQRVFTKIAAIVREEMNKAGAQEILMPAVQPAELWQESGRWQQYGPELLRFQDRKGADFCIGPTHEEVVTALIRDEVKSARQLPLNVYQIQTKFRDEVRPRFGLMRGREFTMKDAYSFDVSEEKALEAYDRMYEAYHAIFRRCGLRFTPVEADTGSIGGNRSHEFQVLADTGEDALVYIEGGYAANVELAPVGLSPSSATSSSHGKAEQIATPGVKTVEQLTAFLKIEPEKILKAMMLKADEKNVMILCRGDRTLNEIKARKALGVENLRMMSESEVMALGLIPGFMGPIALSEEIRSRIQIVADQQVLGCVEMVCGGNTVDTHWHHVDVQRDVGQLKTIDCVLAQAGDVHPATGKPYQEARGIEVGHVFYLGTKYSKAMKAEFLDEKGQLQPMVMGCYGIGVTRTAAAAIEQNHDDDGIIWPAPIAPFQVALLTLGAEKEVVELAEKLYQEWNALGIEVLFDERDERPGTKFKDHDLIGCPLRVAVGARGLKEGVIEIKPRRASKDGIVKVPLKDATQTMQQMLAELMKVNHGK